MLIKLSMYFLFVLCLKVFFVYGFQVYDGTRNNRHLLALLMETDDDDNTASPSLSSSSSLPINDLQPTTTTTTTVIASSTKHEDHLVTINETCAKNCKCLDSISTIRCFNAFYLINQRTMFNSAVIRVFIKSYESDVLESGRLNSGNRVVSFSLTHSLVKHVDVDCFAGETNIEYLDLSFNRIETLHIAVFRVMLGLKILNISSNPLTNIEGSLLFDGKPLRNLQMLNMANTKLLSQKQLLNLGRLPYVQKRFKLCVDDAMRKRRSMFFYTCNCKTRNIDNEACGQVQYIDNENGNDMCRSIERTEKVPPFEDSLLCNVEYFVMRNAFTVSSTTDDENVIKTEMRISANTISPIVMSSSASPSLSSTIMFNDLWTAIVNVFNMKVFLYAVVIVVASIVLILFACIMYFCRNSICDLCFWKCYFCRKYCYKRTIERNVRSTITRDDLVVLRQHPDGRVVRRPIVRTSFDESSPLSIGVAPTSLGIANENYNYYLTPITLNSSNTTMNNDIASCINDPANKHVDTDAIIYDTASKNMSIRSSAVDDYSFDDYWGSEFDENETLDIEALNKFQNAPLPPIPTDADEAIYTEIIE